MKYSNLTYREKILRWFDLNPSTINSLCEVNQHILDWIYGGYRGKLSAKIDLTIKLINRGADLSKVKIETFRTILFTFISPIDSQDNSAVFVLKAILQEKSRVQEIKKDLPFFNSLILTDSIWNAPNSDLKNQILYSDISGNLPPFVKDIAHKINYNIHPVIFLLQHYFFFTSEFKTNNANPFLKIDKIHELNEEIIFNKMSFQYHENYQYIQDQMISASIGVNDNVLNVLEKIKHKYENNKSSLSTKSTEEIINIIDMVIKRDFYRNLNSELPENSKKQKRLKI
jgi:hypothetical protein